MVAQAVIPDTLRADLKAMLDSMDDETYINFMASMMAELLKG